MLNNDFRSKIDKLPDEVKEIILSDKISNEISDIANKYELTPEQSGKIAEIIGKIFVKDIPLNEFINNLKTQATLKKEKAQLIISDLIKNIFLPIENHFPDSMALIKKIESSPDKSIEEKNVVNLKDREEKQKEE